MSFLVKNSKRINISNENYVLVIVMAKKASKEEMIGFHKGALTTLAKEREEMAKILSIVEQLMQMHVKSLQDLGVDLTKEVKKQKTSVKKPKIPIEDII